MFEYKIIHQIVTPIFLNDWNKIRSQKDESFSGVRLLMTYFREN